MIFSGGGRDTDYNSKSGYMRGQRTFKEWNLAFTEGNGVSMVVLFLNIFDRGYRSKMVEWLTGKQDLKSRCVQPRGGK